MDDRGLREVKLRARTYERLARVSERSAKQPWKEWISGDA